MSQQWLFYTYRYMIFETYHKFVVESGEASGQSSLYCQQCQMASMMEHMLNNSDRHSSGIYKLVDTCANG